MYIERHEEINENLCEQESKVLLLFSAQYMDESFRHDYGRIVANDGEDVLYPFVDALSDGGLDGLVVELDRFRRCRKTEIPMAFAFSVRIVILDDIGSRLMDQGKSPYDDMGGDSRIEKRKYIRNDRVVFSGGYDLAKTDMEIVIIALCFFLILLGSLDSGERFSRFGSGRFGLLFPTVFRPAFAIFEIIDTVESHIRKIIY